MSGTSAITKRSRFTSAVTPSQSPTRGRAGRRRKPKSSGSWHRDTASSLARQRETPAPAMTPLRQSWTDGCPQSVDGCVEMNYNCATSGAPGALSPGLRAQAIAARGSVRIVRTERASGVPFSGLCAACQHAADSCRNAAILHCLSAAILAGPATGARLSPAGLTYGAVMPGEPGATGSVGGREPPPPAAPKMRPGR